ncbi:hypothetical protein FBU59_005208 [Linderina macrospora]|uniref:Uncharacterized protein n=1 Tax=Linderina macrospora TaxID=4868 RepID=A0ACC1J3C8_9FUNG|nr:hypothetical protein FBU59_005208 [Linderina macrospora]
MTLSKTEFPHLSLRVLMDTSLVVCGSDGGGWSGCVADHGGCSPLFGEMSDRTDPQAHGSVCVRCYARNL